MNALRDRLARLIAAAGPLTVADYMAACLFDPEHGYYTTRTPFGARGDFITAPDVSQMFGELLGVWVLSAMRAASGSEPARLIEIGPGRGTLMADMLRTLFRLDPALEGRLQISLVEASPRLTEIQKRRLAGLPAAIEWQRDIRSLPGGPAIFVANELFDALPVRQFVKTAQGWHERLVGLDVEGGLCFLAGPQPIPPGLLPADAGAAPPGSVIELSPAATGMMDAIAGHIAIHGGAGLFIDYGYQGPATGDTLQAMRRHAYEPVLATPGEADLTAHVDFAALAAAAHTHGLATRLMSQGAFLLAIGLLERAGALGSTQDESGRERLRGEVARLAGPDAMGELFKVLIVGPQGLPLPPETA